MLPVQANYFYPSLLITIILLSGCGSVQTPQIAVDTTTTISAVPEIKSVTAADLLDQAAVAPSPQSERLLFEAAQLMQIQGDLKDATEVLSFIKLEGLDSNLTASILLLQAELSISNKQPTQVMNTLRASNFPNLEQLQAAQKIRYHELRAKAQFDIGNKQQSALESILLDPLLTIELQRNNHEFIWQALFSLPLSQLRTQAVSATNFDVRGWYQLALIGRTSSNDLDRHLLEINNWRAEWSSHPAATVLPHELELIETIARDKPQHIALLLPMSTTAGTIVRDAFMSAYFNLQEIGGQVPAVKIYDTNGGTDIRSLHLQARQEGAQLIIGPLLKQDVALLQKEADLGVPTLALNNVEGQTPRSPLLFQFALSPETEARQLANKAWQDGHRRVAVLSPQDEAGNDFYARKRESFLAEWQRLGGQLVALDIYKDNYTSTIASMLLLTASEQRMNDLQELIGKPIQFVQHRRQDIDFIYLVAQPAPARQIVPSLAYLYAAEIPIYASQDVYSGLSRPVEDKDINGVTFGDSPWLLHEEDSGITQTRDLFPMNTAQNMRLQAFGMDAFTLYPRLLLLENSSTTKIPGATGMLMLGPNNNIDRELIWVVIRNGLAQAEL
ncbi:MAG: penicillin-binding protein activator [Pseudohongiellaceae bacterium]